MGDCFGDYSKVGDVCEQNPGGCYENQYRDSDGNCQYCHHTCRSCKDTDKMFDCTRCKINRLMRTVYYFGVNSDEYVGCYRCPLGCDSCIDENSCTSCHKGYKFDSENYCVRAAGEKFGGCTFTGVAVIVLLLILL
eukprot:TRINITY_DN3301_c0_g1_i4.p1 TRINITY_DN3301_c0_g1~~TRINITY_DN3301_c0_g1_i4.p1  ORF type:complete len:136 (-),score=6.87 TRINITY_DN3301_c0_g1_i4:180-587(-)